MSGAIGIFGGTFDPIHLGHRYLAEAAIAEAGLDKLIIMPAKIPPHKADAKIVSGEQRLEMCRLAFSNLDKAEISDHELGQEGKSYSYNTVRWLKESYPDSRICFIMGSDQLEVFDTWYRWQDILELADIIVLSREDGLAAEVLEKKAARFTDIPGKVTVIRVKPFEISSTKIRKMLGNNEDCSCYLDKKVIEYIKEEGLYNIAPQQGFDKKKYSSYKSYIKEHLSKKRAQHSMNVADAAVKLARLYNGNEEKAYVAGLLHDVCKEMPPEKQLEYVMRSPLDVSEYEKKTTALFHAVAGSVFIQEEFGIADPEIIRAVRYHTVACGDMDKLSQIIYIADLISDDRDYKDVKKMRKYAEQGLEKAMLEALKFSLADSVGKENTIPLCTLEAYNYFLKVRTK